MRYFYPHFTDEETEAQRRANSDGEEACGLTPHLPLDLCRD